MKNLLTLTVFCAAFGAIGCGSAPPPTPINTAAHSSHMQDINKEMADKYKAGKSGPSAKGHTAAKGHGGK